MIAFEKLFKRIQIIGLATLIPFSISCGGSAQNSQIYKLPSGSQIKVNGISRMNSSSGDSALVMSYETEIPIENKEALQKEINEIWSIFQKDVEKASVKVGIIRAVHYEGSGLIRNGNGYGFVYVKGSEGQWHQVEDEAKRN